MQKLKVGDKVRCKKEYEDYFWLSETGVEPNAIFTIKQMHERFCTLEEVAGKWALWRFEKVTPIAVTTELNHEPKLFKAGDKVRRVDDRDDARWRKQAGVPYGTELTVKYCSPLSIEFEEAYSTWCTELFEPVEQPVDTSKTPSDWLREAADTLDERGKQYDASGSERSMAKTVAIFNILTKNSLTVAEGWQFMKVLKDVRLWSNTDVAHVDSIVDNLGYTALLAEETISLGGKLKEAKD